MAITKELKDDYEKKLEAEGTPINKETHEISINYYNQPFVERKRKRSGKRPRPIFY